MHLPVPSNQIIAYALEILTNVVIENKEQGTGLGWHEQYQYQRQRWINREAVAQGTVLRSTKPIAVGTPIKRDCDHSSTQKHLANQLSSALSMHLHSLAVRQREAFGASWNNEPHVTSCHPLPGVLFRSCLFVLSLIPGRQKRRRVLRLLFSPNRMNSRIVN